IVHLQIQLAFGIVPGDDEASLHFVRLAAVTLQADRSRQLTPSHHKELRGALIATVHHSSLPPSTVCHSNASAS
ncbi:hypothetical protein E2320_001381, partial [Naja naja]